MRKYSPFEELAPRDTVSRAVWFELLGGQDVYLDATGLDCVVERFPCIHHTCLQHGIDATSAPIPVTPAAHYMMGGIRVDVDGRTQHPDIFAAGEVSCSGLHGANRLASNSLAEALVFGRRVGKAITKRLNKNKKRKTGSGNKKRPPSGKKSEKGTFSRKKSEKRALIRSRCAESGLDFAATRKRIQDTCWKHVGILRTGEALETALRELSRVGSQLDGAFTTSQEYFELRNLWLMATLVAEAAKMRTESRGAHHRLDYAGKNAAWRKHVVVTQKTTQVELKP